MTQDSHSFWLEHPLPQYHSLDRDLTVDVVVAGGGLTGITAAYLLRREGVKVALLERRRLVAGDSGHTTAHLTYVTDMRLSTLAEQLGKDAARAFWEAGAVAIDEIASLAQRTNADCDFKWVDGFLHQPLDEDRSRAERDRLHKEAELARELGFDAVFIDGAAALEDRAAVRFQHQARFHPRKYAQALLRDMAGEGSYIFENTDIQSVEDGSVHANGYRIHCDYLVITTHNPLMGHKGVLSAALFQTKLALYTSYVIGATLPKGVVPEALYWDTRDPYDYLRIDARADRDFAIFGGDDVKTGQERSAGNAFEGVERRFTRRFPQARLTHRWMGQVIETTDGMPFMGENAAKQFIATGFNGNGFTLGTIGALMARDRFLGRKNPWEDLFRVDRKPFHGGAWKYNVENFDYPYYQKLSR